MLIDSHCHIPHKKYERSTEEILSEGNSVGVDKFITIGTSLKDNRIALETANKYPEIYFSVAIYPHEDMNFDTNYLINELETEFLNNKDSKLVALGECGIDMSNWKGGRDIKDQLHLFEEQIKLAVKYDLPLVVHNRNGNNYVLELLNRYVPLGLKGVIHCFDADWEYAKDILNLGFYISFSGMITYPKKDYLIEVVKNVPLDRFLVETDAPYLAPQRYRGQVNYSKYVKVVVEKIAGVKKLDLMSIEGHSYENTSKLFSL